METTGCYCKLCEREATPVAACKTSVHVTGTATFVSRTVIVRLTG
uniref:Uncharacterized protein n=1 Tax=Arundo donax TaxID=35708 RepID=A0A0A9CR68_ARUDO